MDNQLLLKDVFSCTDCGSEKVKVERDIVGSCFTVSCENCGQHHNISFEAAQLLAK